MLKTLSVHRNEGLRHHLIVIIIGIKAISSIGFPRRADSPMAAPARKAKAAASVGDDFDKQIKETMALMREGQAAVAMLQKRKPPRSQRRKKRRIR